MTRFSFGRNWSEFSKHIDEEAILAAEDNLRANFGADLRGKSFLDIGCGSGLFSLAATRLGASVTCFDFDPKSVETTNYVLTKHGAVSEDVNAFQDDILAAKSNKLACQFDFVYSWGVLHHTGNMNLAFQKTAPLVKEGGRLFIAIYNDQGFLSKVWRVVKFLYCSSPAIAATLIIMLSPFFYLRRLLRSIFLRQPIPRGMSTYHDMLDWLGGFPFEVARPDEIVTFFEEKGFSLYKSNLVGRKLGCNEFIFIKTESY